MTNMVNKFLAVLVMITVSISSFSQSRYIVFANGYRGLSYDSVTTSNNVYTSPFDGYWYDFDDTIISRFQGVTPIYIDGHHPISTSTHRTKIKSYVSWFTSRFGVIGNNRMGFNDKPNPEGFKVRFDNGKTCGEKFVNNFLNSSQKDTVDIVCHSMGYAYALGFIESIKPHVVLGKILIMAPESPSEMGMDWNLFNEVWQYGCDENDVTFYQDGVAPQSPVLGLEKLDKEKGGRVFIPENGRKGFIRSHHLKYWNWFYTIKEGDYGWFGK
jgi:hypothetical protein